MRVRTYSEGPPDTQIALGADGCRDSVTSGDANGTEILVGEGLQWMRHSCELIDIEKFSLFLWIGYVDCYTTERSVVVDTARPDLCDCSEPHTL